MVILCFLISKNKEKNTREIYRTTKERDTKNLKILNLMPNTSMAIEILVLVHIPVDSKVFR